MIFHPSKQVTPITRFQHFSISGEEREIRGEGIITDDDEQISQRSTPHVRQLFTMLPLLNVQPQPSQAYPSSGISKSIKPWWPVQFCKGR